MCKFGRQGEISETINATALTEKIKYLIINNSYIIGTSVAEGSYNTPTVGSEVAEGSAMGVLTAGGGFASPGRTGVHLKKESRREWI